MLRRLSANADGLEALRRRLYDEADCTPEIGPLKGFFITGRRMRAYGVTPSMAAPSARLWGWPFAKA